MFIVLSSWHSHCESSPGSFDECRLSAGWPPTLRPNKPIWAVSPPIGCYHPQTPSPFYYHYSARKLILILPSHGGWKAVTKYERCNGAGTQGTVSPFLCIHRQVANNRRREALCFLAVRLSVRPAGLSVKNGVRVTPYLSLYLRHFNEYVWLGIIEKIRGQMFKVIWSNALYWLKDTHRLTSVRPWSVNTYFSWRGSRDISVGRLSGSISMKFGPNIHGVWVSIAALTA